jgi:hypothetical protein
MEVGIVPPKKGGVRRVECSELAVDGAQEAMSHEVRVEITAQDRLARRHSHYVRDEKGSQKCGRELKQGELTAGSAKEDLGIAVGVKKSSRDRACGVGDKYLEGCARARNFERGEGAVLGAQEGLKTEVRIIVGSHDRPLWGYESRRCSMARAWSVERSTQLSLSLKPT